MPARATRAAAFAAHAPLGDEFGKPVGGSRAAAPRADEAATARLPRLGSIDAFEANVPPINLDGIAVDDTGEASEFATRAYRARGVMRGHQREEAKCKDAGQRRRHRAAGEPMGNRIRHDATND